MSILEFYEVTPLDNLGWMGWHLSIRKASTEIMKEEYQKFKANLGYTRPVQKQLFLNFSG